MPDSIAICVLAALLVTFFIYLMYKRRADEATRHLAWVKDVIMGILLIFFGGFHLYLALTSRYSAGETGVWVFGRLIDGYLTLGGVFIAVRAMVTRQSHVNVGPG